MFRNNYQGGAVVEIFSGQGKDPVAKWKLSGGPSAIHKEYNKEVRGFVYCLEGSSQTVKMQMPENGKMSLGLLQRFFVLQVNIPQYNDFSVELVITDSEHLKRRLHLSTVHKELSATLLHAKIPFVGLKRSVWSTLCVDLVSFTGELFKGFLKLDGITLFATCKVRRIFTMKTEPTEMSKDDMVLSGAGLMDLIPPSCQFPPDVTYVTQVLNMENLRKADVRAGLLSSDSAPDQSSAAVSTSYRGYRTQGVSHTASASGSRVSGPLPQTERKSSTGSDGTDRSVPFISNAGSQSSGINQKVAAETESIAKPRILGSLQPRPPKDGVSDKQGSKKLRVYSAGRERIAPSASPDGVLSDHRNRSKITEKCTPLPRMQQCRHHALTLTEKTKHLTAGSSGDLSVRGSWESNEGSEPQLTLQDEVFIFSSQPHSPKRGQVRGDQKKMEVGDDQVQNKKERRCEAQPEDDFIGSESDEDELYTKFNTASPRSLGPTLAVQFEVHPESHHVDQTTPDELSPATTSMQPPSSGRGEPAWIAPTRCRSPSATASRQELKCGRRGSGAVNQFVDEDSSFSLSRRLLQEVKLDDSPQRKEEEVNTLRPVGSDYDLHVLSSLRVHGDDDDDELRMLASLKREQKEDECSASGLSASQIHHCNVSVGMSSDDASTWTHVSMPANQGRHYQKEMNPLLQSNPREWMDVLSPPIMPPSQLRRSGSTWNNLQDLIGGRDGSAKEEEEEEEEDEYLNLLYDPCLNCYFDPKTGKYYELA